MRITVTMYSVIELGSALVLPDHHVRAELRFGDGVVHMLEEASFWTNHSRDDTRLHTVQQGDRQVIQSGPGFIVAHIAFRPPEGYEWSRPGPIDVSVIARAAGHHTNFRTDVTIPPEENPRLFIGSAQTQLARWSLPSSNA
jgi:hypothetical protein